jgi:hypothetical protein
MSSTEDIIKELRQAYMMRRVNSYKNVVKKSSKVDSLNSKSGL